MLHRKKDSQVNKVLTHWRMITCEIISFFKVYEEYQHKNTWPISKN